jgi:hypothetical protein
MNENENNVTPPEFTNRPPHRILFIIDNVVEDIIFAPVRMASILLSDPVIFDGTNLEENEVNVGYRFDPVTKTFREPTIEEIIDGQ